MIRVALGLMVLMVMFYVLGAVAIAVILAVTGGVTGFLMALGVLVLAYFAFWGVFRDLGIALASRRMLTQLANEGWTREMIVGNGPKDDPIASAEHVTRLEAEIAEGQDDWRTLMKLAVALDGIGDRNSAIAATRQAIRARRFQN